MTNFKVKSKKYLPFDHFHIVKVNGLDESSIKGSAGRVSKDRATLKHSTALNFMCKEFGLKGGFAQFKNEHHAALKAFKAQHNLRTEGLYEPETYDRPITISVHDVAGRYFWAQRPLPSHVFTGAGVDWFDLLKAALALPDVTVVNIYTGKVVSHENEFNPLRSDIPMNWVAKADGKELSLATCWQLSNLMGDQLLQFSSKMKPKEPVFIAQYYFSKLMHVDDIKQEEEALQNAAALLSRIIGVLKTGWVDIVSFNKSLIFIRDYFGGYDFAFPNMRKTGFDHNIHQPYLKNADIPKSDDQYHFQRWLYFEYRGWLEEDQHEAEKLFYQNGGIPINYPGEIAILRKFMQVTGAYVAPHQTAPLVEGFKPVMLGGKLLAVSDLVTIEKFRSFMINGNELYTKYRCGSPEQDDWERSNQIDDIASSPASVTWYDALAYTTYISKTQKIPARLASEQEWLGIACEWREDIAAIANSIDHRPENTFVKRTDVDPRSGFWGTRNRCVAESLPWQKTKDEVSFIRSVGFGEWLGQEGAAINSLHLGAMNAAPMHFIGNQSVGQPQSDDAQVDWDQRASAERVRMSPRSTGAYKNMRIGFRMVYEITA